MSLIVITGANRGIGLELAKIYRKRGDQVVATCRKSSAELEALGVEVYAGLEVSSPQDVKKFQNYLGKRSIDILINNAGILGVESLENLDVEKIKQQFEVNALAPLLVTQGLLSQLHSGSKVALVTSRMGSIADNGSGSYYGYRMSKAALNMAGVSLARDLKSQGIAVLILHPGMVATEMTAKQGIAPADAAQQLVARIDELGLAESGKFWHANGEELPW